MYEHSITSVKMPAKENNKIDSPMRAQKPICPLIDVERQTGS